MGYSHMLATGPQPEISLTGRRRAGSQLCQMSGCGAVLFNTSLLARLPYLTESTGSLSGQYSRSNELQS